jgi:hypothetical protein
MPKYQPGVSENLHALNRYLTNKHNRTLTISDTINFLAIYYVNKEKLATEIHIIPGIWLVNGIGDEDKVVPCE